MENFPPPLPSGYGLDHPVVPDEHHYAGVNDRFALGSFALMRPYMATRYCKMLKEVVYNPLPEAYLVCVYNESGIYMKFEPELHSEALNWQGGPELQAQCGTLSPDFPALIRST